MQENNTLGYDDIVAMTSTQEELNDDIDISEQTDEFEKFESWVMTLGEGSAIASQDQEEQAEAILSPELVGPCSFLSVYFN